GCHIRLAFYLFKSPAAQYENFLLSAQQLKQNVTTCRICYNMAENPTCPVCADAKRNRHIICVVEDPLDVVALEHARRFEGVYHVLGGAISPIDGIGPEQLKIAELPERVKKLQGESSEPIEIILATNPSLEGDATAMYIVKLLRPLGVKLTRLARGIPVGGDLEYTDELTLSDAIGNRKEI
ncbi:MAG: recombination mediator RecR, partial [Patescibacteria group bacterium]|nr:recombination mediator RecR [Patescibacteria group bacterium]